MFMIKQILIKYKAEFKGDGSEKDKQIQAKNYVDKILQTK